MARAKATDFGGEPGEAHSTNFWTLVIGSIGVVYGDIGTSPLYAFREAVRAASSGSPANTEAVFGVLSLIFWALILIVTLKYVIVLLRADNKGEGGTFALMALGQSVAKRSSPLLLGLGIAGASFFYGDAVITPAISVLSAVEGLTLVSPVFQSWVIPLALIIIVGLFAVQSHGTARMAQFFGPLTVVWFLALAGGGLLHIFDNPGVVGALNPWYGVRFLATHGLLGLTVLGLVFLAVTGAEALYADLGHFGRKPLQAAWLGFVFPALMLNYLGQGALVLSNADALENPFYRLYPEWALVPMVVLATAATVVASQAVITGAFSLARQAIQLGLLPRFFIRHTSESMAGQIYLPRVNWLLLAGVVITVISFKSSSSLATAYGVSVTATLVINSLMAFFVVWRYWRWPLWKAAALMVPLLLIEQTFFAANIMKLVEGAWFPLLIAAVVSLVMVTWVKGYRILTKLTRRNEADLDWLVRKLEAKPPVRVPGTAIFLSADVNAAPTALMHNLKHNRVLHERNFLLSIRTEETPRVPRHERVTIDRSNETFIRIVASYGFMETPSIPKILDSCRRKDLNIDIGATSFFLSRRSLRTTTRSEMPRWQERLFIWLARTAEDATTYFQIPTDRVVEVGTQVAI
ncbi:potassium transporter Kup [Hyphomicrobium sp.]|uniref:potassium transporter Kup n=1 Tax=Hyphomicrobium sp. TaxID=82 RepID=UPI0025BEBE97|nr:potassium transporter Kup [Hyphomicrobium sp.]MCC7251916.1 potassium transporter Kup [Hyphomicrobium sp.]